MLAAQALPPPKFLRKTVLLGTEANTNFKMLDNDIAEAVTSADADAVTPLMSKIYTRLLLTPEAMREGARVLRFAGEEREGKWVTAWEQLRGHLRVSGETANKALRWMHEQGIIGYCAGKNGVGIRIFLNRAASSVARRPSAPTQKILTFGRASSAPPRTSAGETPFKDSFAVQENLDSDIKFRAPKNGADGRAWEQTRPDPAKLRAEPLAPTSARRRGDGPAAGGVASAWMDGSASAGRVALTSPGKAAPSALAEAASVSVTLEEIVLRLKSELEPALHSAARQAAAREHERTREWLETRGLPKAARVAQQEAYGILRKQGALTGSQRGTRTQSEVGRRSEAATEAHALAPEEINELAEACVALLEAQGRPVERTLAELSVGAGGFVLPPDAARVRERVESLLARGAGGGGRRAGDEGS